MKNILVIADPIDDDQIAFKKAISLANFTVAKIHVVVFRYESLGLIDTVVEESKIKEMVLDRAKKNWELFLKKQDLNLTVTYEIVWEKYIEPWVTKHCNSIPYDLIVKTGNRSEASFHTPTDWELFRKSKVPIYCVSKDVYKPEKKVLVALDLATKDEKKKKLNSRVLEAAFQLSLQMNSSLHCCCALKIPLFVDGLDLIDTADQVENIEKRIKENADILFDEYDMTDNNLFVQKGIPWEIIVNHARDIKAECIVIGSMGRKGIEGKLVGNTAEKVIHYTKSDLLVISPD